MWRHNCIDSLCVRESHGMQVNIRAYDMSYDDVNISELYEKKNMSMFACINAFTSYSYVYRSFLLIAHRVRKLSYYHYLFLTLYSIIITIIIH